MPSLPVVLLLPVMLLLHCWYWGALAVATTHDTESDETYSSKSRDHVPCEGSAGNKFKLNTPALVLGVLRVRH
jgi:hypothetical protein